MRCWSSSITGLVSCIWYTSATVIIAIGDWQLAIGRTAGRERYNWRAVNKQASSTTSIEYRLKPILTNVEMNALFSHGSPERGWPEWQKTPDTSDWEPVLAQSLTWVCAYASAELVGFVNVAWDGREHAFLLDARVHPGFRRQGIGKELVSRAAAAAQQAGCTVLHVDFAEGLTSFYEACGFRPTPAGLLRLD